MSAPEAPQGVSVRLADGTKVPCRVRFYGFDEDGCAEWGAEPIEPRQLTSRPVALEVAVMPGRTTLFVSAGHVTPHH